MIPTIETERLILREHRLSDFEDYCEMWRDPDVVRFIGGSPLSRQGAWARLLRHAGVWHYMGFGFFAIEEKSTGHFVGEAGFQELRRDIEPSMEGTLEAGWGLVPSAQGWGYATEVMTALFGWADETFPHMRRTCLIDPDNLASIRVAQRFGFTQLARVSYQGEPSIIFERAAPSAR